jgi:hypothetical protein
MKSVAHPAGGILGPVSGAGNAAWLDEARGRDTCLPRTTTLYW